MVKLIFKYLYTMGHKTFFFRHPFSGRPCDRRRIRTFDRLLRRQVLYPAELCDRPTYAALISVKPHKKCGETGTRTQATLSR